jgi:outer membrane protein
MKPLLLALALFLLVPLSQGQELLTMEKAVAIALEKNTVLRGAAEDVEASRWGSRNALTNFLPKVSINAGMTTIDPETDRRANASIEFIKAIAPSLGIPQAAMADLKPFAYRTSYTAGFTAVQPIYNGGAEFLGLSYAEASADRSTYQYQDTEQDVIARVRISYLNVLKAHAMVSVAGEAVERSKRHLETTRRRADVGMRTKTDILRWEVQLASDQGNLVNVDNFLAASRLQLNEVMGVELNKEFELQVIDLSDTVAAEQNPRSELLASLSTLTDAGPGTTYSLDDHPAMRMMQANVQLAGVGIEKAEVNFKPRINLGFTYGFEQNNTLKLDGIRPWALALTFSLPVFNGFGDYTNVQKARAEYKRTEAQAESFRRGLQLQASSAELALRAARQRIEIARKSKQEAADVLESVTRRYESGGASNVDLIDVQTAYTSARTNYITAVHEYYVAQVQLARATGTVTP